MNERTEPASARGLEESPAVRITCSEHGELIRATVHCRHDIEDVIRRVGHAHAAPYGGGCKATIDLVLIDVLTGEPIPDQGVRRWVPPVQWGVKG